MSQSPSIDLQGLSIDRTTADRSKIRPRRHIVTRYLLPLALLGGFAGLITWAAWDQIFPPQPVTVMSVIATTAESQQEGTPLFQAAGWIEPRPTPIRVAALAPGVVEQLLVVEDQPMQTGDPIAKLVTDDARLALEGARADEKLRRAEVDQAKANLAAAITRFEQPVHLEAALSQAEAELAKTETLLKDLPFHLKRAQADYDANLKDYEGKQAARDVVAGIDVDKAESARDSSLASVEEYRDRIVSTRKEQSALIDKRDALQTQLELLADERKARDEAQAKLKAAEARVAQAAVAIEEAQLRLDRMTIRSPVEGRVFRLIAHPGARIGSGMTQMEGHDGSTVVTMYIPTQLQIRVDVRFEDIPKVILGQPVEIGNPALPSPLTGRVLFVSSEADIQKNTLQVKVEISDPPDFFKPEMLVDVTFLAPPSLEKVDVTKQELRLYLPQEYLRREDGRAFVWVADRSDGVVRKVSVQTAEESNHGLIEITEGLKITSKIVASSTSDLTDGDRIRITEEAKQPALFNTSQNGEGE